MEHRGTDGLVVQSGLKFFFSPSQCDLATILEKQLLDPPSQLLRRAKVQKSPHRQATITGSWTGVTGTDLRHQDQMKVKSNPSPLRVIPRGLCLLRHLTTEHGGAQPLRLEILAARCAHLWRIGSATQTKRPKEPTTRCRNSPGSPSRWQRHTPVSGQRCPAKSIC